MSELKSSADVLNRFMGEATTESAERVTIKGRDIRKGDLIRKEYDTTRDDAGGTKAVEFWAVQDGDQLAHHPGKCFLMERPVQLPTEPGFYMTPASPPDVFQLLETGAWFEGQTPISNERVRHDGGNSLTLLRPVAEVAAEVLARLASWWEFGPPQNFVDEFDAIAAEFGVTK